MEDIELADDASLAEDGWVGVAFDALDDSVAPSNNGKRGGDGAVWDGGGSAHIGSVDRIADFNRSDTNVRDHENKACTDSVLETSLAELHVETEGNVTERECANLLDEDEWVGFTLEELRDIAAWEEGGVENAPASTSPKPNITYSMDSRERSEHVSTRSTALNAKSGDREAEPEKKCESGSGSRSLGVMPKLNFLMNISKGTAAKLFWGRKTLWDRKRRHSIGDDPPGELEETISGDETLGNDREGLHVFAETPPDFVMEDTKSGTQTRGEQECVLHDQLDGNILSHNPPGDVEDAIHDVNTLKDQKIVEKVSSQGCARAFAATQKKKENAKREKGEKEG